MTDSPGDLRAQFVAAAQELIDRRRRRRRWRLLAGAAVVLVVAGFGVTVVDRSSPPASASVVKVQHDGDEIVIDILGRIDDAAAAQDELEQSGIHARLRAVPVPPFLVGHVVSAHIDHGEMEPTRRGQRITSVRMPSSYGRVTINYGREADVNEAYEASGSPPNCDEYLGRIASASVRSQVAAEFGPSLRWQIQQGGISVNVDEGALTPESRIIDIIPESPERAVIVATDGESEPLPGTECGNK